MKCTLVCPNFFHEWNPVNTSIADLYSMFLLVKCLFQHSVQDGLVASGDKFS